MRTFLLRELDKQLFRINRGLSHTLFISEQFLIDQSALIAKQPDLQSSDAFKKNAYSQAFNYKLSEIALVIKDFQEFSSRSFYTFLYSAFELYVTELLRLTSELTKLPLPNKKKLSAQGEVNKALEETFLLLGLDYLKELDQHQRNTIDYIRWRRNGIVHAEGKVPPELVKLIISEGVNIDSYWAITKVKPRTLSFATTPSQTFSPNEIIELIRVVRELSEVIDKRVLAAVNTTDIIDYVLSEFRKDHKLDIRGKPRARVENIFGVYMNRKFGLDKRVINMSLIAF